MRPFAEHLGAAAEAFTGDAFASSSFGPDVVEQYGRTARYEWRRFLDAVTDWQLERYFELI